MDIAKEDFQDTMVDCFEGNEIFLCDVGYQIDCDCQMCYSEDSDETILYGVEELDSDDSIICGADKVQIDDSFVYAADDELDSSSSVCSNDEEWVDVADFSDSDDMNESSDNSDFIGLDFAFMDADEIDWERRVDSETETDCGE